MKRKVLSFILAAMLMITLMPTVIFPVSAEGITVKETASRLDYFNIYDFHDGLVRVYKGKSLCDDGFIDKTGKEILPVGLYDGVGDFSDGLAWVSKGDKSGFIDKTGKVVIQIIYDGVKDFSEGLAAVSKNYKWGYIDKTGKVVVPLEYDYGASPFREGLARVSKDGKYGYIDKTGKVVIPLEYFVAGDFHDGLACVSKSTASNYYDKKYGYIDKTGKVVIPFEYDRGSNFSEGLAVVVKNNLNGVIDKTGKFIVPFGDIKHEDGYRITNFKDGVAIIVKNEKKSLIDKTGKVIASLDQYDDLFGFGDKMISVRKDGKYGYIDTTGKLVIPLEYNRALNFYEGVAYVAKDEGYGYIDATNKVVLPFEYTNMSREVCEGMIVAQKMDQTWSIYEIQNSSAAKPAEPIKEPEKPAAEKPSGEHKVGDKLGNVLNSDVKTYINGQRIPCYNINNKAVVLIADLRNYGFDVVYNDKTRTSTVTRNKDKQFTPMQGIENNTAKAGTVAFSYVYTDIVAIVNGKKVESYNVQGNLAIYFESLGDYGTFSWDNATKSSKLTLY